jgi:hypothetical protein
MFKQHARTVCNRPPTIVPTWEARCGVSIFQIHRRVAGSHWFVTLCCILYRAYLPPLIFHSSREHLCCITQSIMRRQRPFSNRETLTLRPKWKRPDYINAKTSTSLADEQFILLLALAICVLVFVAVLLTRLRRNKSTGLPDIPWVGRDRRKWFSKLRARTWTTVNYETALREAYETVRRPL